MKYKLILALAILLSNFANAQEYWNSTLKVGTDGVSEVGKYFDFHDTSNDSKDYSNRLYSAGDHLCMTGGLNIGKYMLIDDPNYTNNWDHIWQCGFFQSYQKSTAPEPYGWFWGINMGHTSNNPDYRYNGQIAIKNSPNAPCMYFRSTGKTGEGLWAKVLIDSGNQNLNGDLTLDGKLKCSEVEVTIDAGADHVFEPDYSLRSLEDLDSFIQENQHLPEVASEKEMQEEGLNMNEFQITLLKKIEELTLYVIEQNKEIKDLREEVRILKSK